MSASLGRNDPCPCGSGKKMKKCCGAVAAPSAGARPGSPEAARLERAFARARELDLAGDTARAREAYLDVLRVDARHLGAMTNLAGLESRLGNRDAAKRALAEAVAVAPLSARAHVNYALALAQFDDDMAGARTHYETALRIDPKNVDAHKGLAFILLRAGEHEQAARVGRVGFAAGAEPSPFRGDANAKPVSVLLLKSAMQNIAIDRVLDEAIFQAWTLIVEFFDPKVPLPAHDVVLNCVGDAELDGGPMAFAAVERVLTKTRARVINPPSVIRATGRVENARRLRDVPGVVTARTELWSRDRLRASDAEAALAAGGYAWPLLLRSPGFHTGHHFVLVESAEAFRAALPGLPGDELLVIQFLDTRGRDGKFRKYRVMFIGGQLYPLHLAVSPSWKVHYFSADMAENAQHRAEDAAFLGDMRQAIGARAVESLEALQQVLALDYGGIDFALDADGRVVVFEANASMLIAPVGADTRWEYRRPAVGRAAAAAQRLLAGL